jgi:glutathione S-transferase
VAYVYLAMVLAHYLNPYVAAALGGLFIIGRAVYFVGYVKAAEGRHSGFMLSFVPTAILLIGALYGMARTLITG